ncbi:hypothetical protein [Nocardia sp. NPDC052112]
MYLAPSEVSSEKVEDTSVIEIITALTAAEVDDTPPPTARTG